MGKKKDKIKDTAKEIMSVSLGFVCAAFLISIGISLCTKGIWVGVLVVIAGYEIARYVIASILKNNLLRYLRNE